MTETVRKGREKIADDASHDEVKTTFDRLLRQYFLGEDPQRLAPAISRARLIGASSPEA